MNATLSYAAYPIGYIRSKLKSCRSAPRQGGEGAPEAWLEVSPPFAEGIQGIEAGQDVIVITWLHEAVRTKLTVHPRGEPTAPLAGVFSTRSPARPNPLGLHRVTVHEVSGHRLRVSPIEAIDGTPVVDIKPVLSESADA